MNADYIYEIMPEHLLIQDESLRQKCIEVWLEALAVGGWEQKGVLNCPVVVNGLNKKAPYNDIDHIRAVTKISIAICDSLEEVHTKAGTIDRDAVIAGALLHDVGNFLEMDIDDNGATFFKPIADLVPHTCSGAFLAQKYDLPMSVVHIILAHSTLFSPCGENACKTREAMIVKYADCLSFYHLQMYYGKE